MVDSLAGVALAAGAGTRLRPLTYLRPKALCPLGDATLLDFALAALGATVPEAAVNVHHGADVITAHVESKHSAEPWNGLQSVHLSHERIEPLGTAGALVHLRRWFGGRDALVVNADTFHDADLAAFVESWDGESAAVLTTTPGPFGSRSTVVASLVPASRLATLPERPCGLWEALWVDEASRGALVTRHCEGVFHDCGTPGSYLAANLAWASAISSPAAARHLGSVVGEGAEVLGSVERCVVWPGATVGATEHLRDAIRAEDTTVLVR